MDTVKKFYEALASDKTMRERAGKLNEKYKDAAPDEAAIAAEIVAFAKSEGYEFSTEELADYTHNGKKELPDEELQAVAGGTYSSGSCFCALGGGGKDGETGEKCACVGAGAGKNDSSGDYLWCLFAGGVISKI